MTKNLRNLCISLAAITALSLGVAAQNFLFNKPVSPIFSGVFKNSAGAIQPLEHLKGQVILLNFWATWCPPCRDEIPAFIRLHTELKHQGFAVVGIAIDKAEKISAFEQEVGINYPSLLAEKAGYALMETYGSQHGALPYTVILDRDGKVVYQHHKGILSYSDARNLIEPFL